jgi:lysozyme family protein
MDAFPEVIGHVLGLEGGYSNDPRDPGGETMWGITVRIARQNGYTGPMRELPRLEAIRIYRAVFWTPLRLDEVAQVSIAVASELFEANVNMWHGAAGSFLQRSLRALGAQLELDGEVGPQTVLALRTYLSRRGHEGEVVLLRCLNGLQLADYVRQVEAQPAKAAFFYGWVRARVVI